MHSGYIYRIGIQEYRRREKEKKKYVHGVGVDEHLEVGI
jgi:hypothetical protein